MSILPSSSGASTGTRQKSNSGPTTFKTFFECWLVEQNQHLQDLVAISQTRTEEQSWCPVQKVLDHYEHYYKAKAEWSKQDVLAILSPSSWTSTFEAAFLWIGGWRPTMAFQLLYSKSGIQLENQLYQLIHGLGKGDLGDLSPSQIVRIDKLQAKTVKEEKNISEKLAKHEGTLADSCMVKLTHMLSEMMRRGDGYEEGVGVEVELAMELKKEGLKEMLRRADDLRLKTLKALIDIMTPSQGVHYLIAAAELHLRIHEWGKVRDGKRLSSFT
ncbi:hypothetical protein Gogos_015837 [Gossypium gossypioides]|uniref:DOG1 domain-containing protein n=1 Tax=Gossypium gossypioides TaxID=34282 RepID=A0A7J9C2X3_GOSGO|nr:hypothetical protein [Gossypium gossypioides]